MPHRRAQHLGQGGAVRPGLIALMQQQALEQETNDLGARPQVGLGPFGLAIEFEEALGPGDRFLDRGVLESHAPNPIYRPPLLTRTA